MATGPEADLRGEFAEFLGPPRGARVLDVGCGPGYLACSLARRGCQVTGVDRGWRLIRIARRLAGHKGVSVRFARAPGERLPFGHATFDIALATTVIYWVERPEAILGEMVRVTRPGGTVATLDPHASMGVETVRAYAKSKCLNREDTRKLVAWARASEHCRRFREEELGRMLRGAGLVHLRLERHMGGLVWFARGIVPAQG